MNLSRTHLVWLVLTSACAAHTSPPRVLIVSGPPELVAPKVVSTEANEIRLAKSPDGGTLLWGSPDRGGGPGGWNIWRSRLVGQEWGPAQPVSFNSDANDFDPAFSSDGAYVYFFSNRFGGKGGDDLYRVAVEGAGYGAVENLGEPVNTAGDEWAPAPSPDGETLLFSSNGHGGRGRHDLFVAHRDGLHWRSVAALPGGVNTAADEFDAAFVDGQGIVFARSINVESDPIALYFSDHGEKGYDAGVALGPLINADNGYTLGPAIDCADRSALFFSGARGDHVGKLDIYRVRFRLQKPTRTRRTGTP